MASAMDENGADVLVLAGDIGYDPRMLVEVGRPNRRAPEGKGQ